MNPWQTNVFEKLQMAIRFLLWTALAINCGVASVYSILFTFRFFAFAWQWCVDHVFAEPW
jgi:hypothetical protein